MASHCIGFLSGAVALVLGSPTPWSEPPDTGSFLIAFDAMIKREPSKERSRAMPHSLEVQSGFAEINRWTPLADWRADARHPWRVGRAKSAGDPGSRDSWSANRDHARDSPSSVSGEAGPIQPDRAGFSRIAPLLAERETAGYRSSIDRQGTVSAILCLV